MHYLPRFTVEYLKERLLDPDVGFWEKLAGQDFERLGLDRALLIAADILLRTGRCDGFSVLDVGCNTGAIGDALAALGNAVSGIDSGVVDEQGSYEPLRDVRRIDLGDFLEADARSWDFMLLLSVVHHWESGYAMSGKPIYPPERIRRIFATIAQRTKYGVYLEMPLDEPGFTPDFSESFLKKYCGDFAPVEINRTIGPNGFLRRLYFLGVGGAAAPAAPLLEKLLRCAHLLEKYETARQTVPRARCFELENALKKRGGGTAE